MSYTLLAACTLVHAGAAIAASACPEGSDALASEAYQSGLAAFRAGRVADSYEPLRKAYEACPLESRYRNDYLVVAVSAGHASLALEIARTLETRLLPTYVLEALGRAARDTRQPDLAIRYYDAILATRADIGAQVGRDLALIDRGEAKQAQADLVALNERHPGRVDILEALGLADEALGKPVEGLAAVEALLRIEPANVGGLQLRYRLLVRAGAPQLADATTPADLVTAAQRGAALRDELAFEFRWARDENSNDIVRARHLDAVIARMRAAIADPATDGQARQGLRGDLVEALGERGRATEAVAEYEAMQGDGIAAEPYVTGAALGAYLALKEPARAAAMFRTIPGDAELSYGVRANYFYALLESEEYDAAVEWADRLTAVEPTYRYANFPGLRTENGDYGRALVVAGLARSYTDRLAEGQARLEAILDVAPADPDARLALAETDALRGWPRRATEETLELLRENPDSTIPLAALFSDQLAFADWRDAHLTLERMVASLPDNDAGLLRSERDWETHQMAEFSIDAQFGQSFGARSGVVDSEIDEYLYSSPIQWDYRAYVHLNQTEGNPVQGNTFRHSAGVGLEYHTPDWLATAELLEIDAGGPYPEFTLESTPSDELRYGLAYSTRTLNIPIAAVVVGVHADRAALNLDYRVSESRDFGAELSHEQFSDGNSRLEALAYWRERWITGPVYKLDTRVDLDTSENTLSDTNYFNPRRDFAATLTFQNQWLQFRHYDRSLSHELDVGLGDYIQEGYGSGLIALLRYQLVYEVNDRLTLKAGVGRTLRPFDGERERLDVVTLNATGRF